MVGALDIVVSLELHEEIDLQDEDLLIRFFFCC